MTKRHGRFAQWAAGVAASVLLATTAQAIVGRASFDPSYGGLYPKLAFSGFADIFVNNSCLGITGFVGFLNPCGSPAMGLVKAEVDLDIFPSTPPIEQTLAFANNPLPGDLVPMIDVYLGFSSFLGRNTITGLDTSPIPTNSSSGIPVTDPQICNLPGFPPCGTPLWLYFVTTFLNNVSETDAFLTTCVSLGEDNRLHPVGTGIINNVNCSISAPARVTFSEGGADLPPLSVPEPGTLGLILAGFGGWFARRRRQLAS
jgi:hypothetical protein